MNKMFVNLKKKLLPALVFILAPGLLFAGESKMLENGIRLIEKPRPFTDTVTAAIFIDGGIFKETAETAGIGALTGIVWVKSNRILETAEFYGAEINAKLTPYAFEIILSAPTDIAGRVLGDFTDFLLKPKFSKEVFEREKALYLEELKANMDNPNYIAMERFNEVAYEGTPYARSVDGTISSVEKLTLKDVENYYKANMQGAQIIASVAGNYDKEFMDGLIKALSAIDKGKPFKIDCSGMEIEKDKRAEDTDTRIKQAKMFVGYTAPAVSSPEYPAVKVLNELLGGRMSSRYFEEIRKKLGYAYSVYSAYPSRVCSSRFFVSVGLDYKNAGHAVEKIDEINRNLPETMTDAEVEKAKKSLLGSALMATQTNAAVAWNAAFFELMGLGADYYDKYVDTLKHISKKDLAKAARIFKGPKAVYILKPSEEK